MIRGMVEETIRATTEDEAAMDVAVAEDETVAEDVVVAGVVMADEVIVIPVAINDSKTKTRNKKRRT